MTLVTIAQSISHTGLGTALRKSDVLFPAIEVVHVFGLTLLLGSVVATDLRFLGVGLRRQPAPEVARTLSPIFWTGLALALGTGAILFVGEPMKCFFNEAFWVKMGLLLAALLFHLTVFRWVTGKPWIPAQRLAAVLSLTLWFGVGVAGRVIGFI